MEHLELVELKQDELREIEGGIWHIVLRAVVSGFVSASAWDYKDASAAASGGWNAGYAAGSSEKISSGGGGW